MAYTLPVMDIDGSSGDASWYLVDPLNTADDAPMFAPYSHVSRVLFHSLFDYFEMTYDVSVSHTFPARTHSVSSPISPLTYTHTPITTLPTDVFCWVLFWQGAEMKNTALHFKGSVPNRKIAPTKSGSNVVITEVLSTSELATVDLPYTWPAITGTFRAIGFKPAAEQVGADPVDIYPSAGRVQFGKGKLDFMARAYLRATAAGVGSFKITQGRSIDATTSAVKFWNPDGTTTTFGTYSGSHPGPTIMTVR